MSTNVTQNEAGGVRPRLQAAQQKLMDKTKLSRKMTTDREAIVFSGMRANQRLPHPIYIAEGNGARITDIDGNEYIDTCMGFGVHVLGHNHPDIAAAIKRIAGRGWHFGIHSPEQMPLASLLHEAIPCAERVMFCNTGSEATLYAMRAARSFTGKDKIAVFEGFWHGMHDYCMVIPDPEGPRHRPHRIKMGHGIPDAVVDLIITLPYRDETAFEIIKEHKDDLAMVIIEPVQHSNPQPEVGPFLHELKRVCAESGVLFMLDEMVTGFRLAYGGGQESFDIVPDLAAFGKAMGGGIPIGCVAGREDIMRLLLGLEVEKGVFTGGTFTGNPLSMAAGTAAVQYMHDHPEIYDHMITQGNRMTAGFNAFCAEHQMPVQMKNVSSMFHIFFQRQPVERMFDVHEESLVEAQQAFFLHCLNYGVLISGANRCYISATHSSEDIDTMIEVFQKALLDVREDGLL